MKAEEICIKPAELNGLVEIPRRRYDKRKDDRQLGIPGGEPSQLLAAIDDAPPIRDDPREAGLEGLEFTRLAAVEGDVFGVLAQPDHAEAKIRLVALLIEIEPDQGITDPACDERTRDGIDESREHHVPRNCDCQTAEWDRQRAGQGPQDRDEGGQGHTGAQQPKGKRQRDGRETVEVLGDALVRVVRHCLVQLHPVVGLVLQPVAQKAVCQPPPPSDMQDLPQVKRINGDDDKRKGDNSENRELPPKFRPIILL